eukprot:gnl/TRDRNA2_/TRDRNA2_205877_c0_seq1.p1 gnl/TRDRNA2_/TRDRNA2_205877_c0~~gnl/TRDRNA2_/TRDRNA2_205877_c0_seq1.p1  ORF type:complete len:409 (-),score=48.11 gnl/TRDRNA2_/TRDRNA2_205877_c0_seq1:125-1234(-)
MLAGEWTFTTVFTIELILRVLAFRFKFVLNLWNWMDVVIVTMAVLDTFDLMSTWNATVMRLARLGKLTRLIKMLTVATHFDSFFFLMRSLRSSVGILFWSLFMLFMVQVIVGIVISQTLRSIIEDDSRPEDTRRAIFLYWGTFSRMILTMFEITLGNWVPSCRLLVDSVSEHFSAVYLLYRCAIGFGMMSVVGAVFIQKTIETAREDETLALKEQSRKVAKVEQKLRKLFHHLDKSRDGLLTHDEFITLLSDPAVLPWLRLLEVDLDDLDKLFTALDGGDGAIEANEFIEGLQMMKGPAHRMDVVSLHRLVAKMNAKVEMIESKVCGGGGHIVLSSNGQEPTAAPDKRSSTSSRGFTLWSRKIEKWAAE